MSRDGRKKAGAAPPRNAWETMLEKAAGADPTQAGEIEPEMEEEPRGGGDKGRDAETGSGGYGGDAVDAGREEAGAQPDRPLDVEIHGDPRTHVGEQYPDETDPEATADASEDAPDLADALADANDFPADEAPAGGGAKRRERRIR